MDFTYVRFSPERLEQAVNDWARTAGFLMEGLDDYNDEYVTSIDGKSLSLFKLLLADADTPACLWSSDEAGILPPDHADPMLVEEFGDTTLLSCITPHHLARFSAALEATDFDALFAKADPAAMAAAGVGLVPNSGATSDDVRTTSLRSSSPRRRRTDTAA
ncbi:hypothetical protein H1V43_38820 [Streptomyces sp. PSKA54]|uniref:Uncharacterized protein n=1 Tax=Streptomyces himalayensis subsp. aureolus TaxID=2758039 RepID=A0A7W2D9C8_9ACTN|nr:hypothetical protein [Streptomyces himalayensis]MBA4867138.1 hypothetical protein [Streptomyces himalayensis subsp. aureolus]